MFLRISITAVVCLAFQLVSGCASDARVTTQAGASPEARQSQLKNELGQITTRFASQSARVRQEWGAKQGDTRRVEYDLVGDKLLERYFGHALAWREKEYYDSVYMIYTALRQESAQEFRMHYIAFRDAALKTKRNWKEENHQLLEQLLTPIVFLFFDASGQQIDTSYYDWLVEHAPSLLKHLTKSDSKLARLGLVMGWNEYAVKLQTWQSEAMLKGILSGAFASDLCAPKDMVMLEDRGEVFCPGQCYEFIQALSELPAERQAAITAELGNAGEICAKIKDLTESTEGLRGQLLGCLREYVDSKDTTACIKVGAEKQGIQDFLRKTFAPQIKVQLPGNCWKSFSPEEERRLRDLDAQARAAYARQDAAERDLQAAQDRLAAATRRQERSARQERLFRMLYPFADEGAFHDDEADRLVESAQRDKQTAEQSLAEAKDDAKRIEHERNGIIDNAKDCSPLSDSCSNTCGIHDERVDRIRECLEAQGTRHERKPGGPDPRVFDPRPDAPGTLDPEEQRLLDCITALLDANRATPTSCGTMMCPPDKIPIRDPITGKCVGCSSKAGAVGPAHDKCASVALCPSDTDCTIPICGVGGAQVGSLGASGCDSERAEGDILTICPLPGHGGDPTPNHP